MNSFKDYEEFKKKKEAFKLQCFFMYSCGFMLITTLILALLSYPLFLIFSSLKLSFVMFILLIVCILNNGRYVSYKEYKRGKKAMYAYLDKILENQHDSDDEINVMMKDFKKLK